MLKTLKCVYSCKYNNFQSWEYIQEYCPYASIGCKVTQLALLQVNIQDWKLAVVWEFRPDLHLSTQYKLLIVL